MVNIVFTDPPETAGRGGRYPWEEIAAQLKTRPNQWALVLRDMPNPQVAAIKRGTYQAFRPAGAFDARAVRTADVNDQRRHDLYIKFLGDDAPAGGGDD